MVYITHAIPVISESRIDPLSSSPSNNFPTKTLIIPILLFPYYNIKTVYSATYKTVSFYFVFSFDKLFETFVN